MKEYILGVNEAGQRLDKYLAKLLPEAPKSFIYKMLRKKNIVLNGKKSEGNEITANGDSVKLFLADDTIAGFQKKQKKAVTAGLPKAEIVYEDDAVIFLNKPVGVLSQRAEQKDVSMNEILIGYLMDTQQLSEEQLKTFSPAVVNRLDRNTSGLIMAGKNLPGLQQLSKALRDRDFKKEYLCIVKGIVKKPMHLEGRLSKDNAKNKVSIADDGDELILTDIKPLAYGRDCSLLLIHLITGKPHQIRAHLASVGHPLFGDAKYGDNEINKRLKEKYNLKNQLLHAWRVSFADTEAALAGLNNRVIYAELPAMFNKILKGEEIKWQPGQEEA